MRELAAQEDHGCSLTLGIQVTDGTENEETIAGLADRNDIAVDPGKCAIQYR